MPRATSKKVSRKQPAARRGGKSRSKSKSGSRKARSLHKSRARTEGSGSGFAFFFFVCLSLATAAAVVIEVRNYIEYPCVQQFRNFRGDVALTLYHRGAARRSAAVFMEQGSILNKPRFITRLFYLEEGGQRGSETERFEELSWSSDGGAVFATRQSASSSQAAANVIPEILWLYDIDSSIFYRVTDSAIPGRGAEASQTFLQRYLYERKGGPGKIVAHWFDLGKKENYAFSWQTTRWNRAAKAAAEAAPGDRGA